MEIAYGNQKIEQALQNSEFRKKLANTWDEDLLALHERGWEIHFEPETYPTEIQPVGFGRKNLKRPRGFFEQLLAACLWIAPEESLINAGAAIEKATEIELQHPAPEYQPESTLTGDRVKELRTARNWSQRKLSSLTGMSQGLISLVENGDRAISPNNEEILKRVFGL